MRLPLPALVSFDFDGTLVDSTAGILRCIRATVVELGLPPAAVEAWRQMIGLPLSVQLGRLLPPERASEVAAGVERYRAHYSRLPPEELGQPFAGVPALLDWLAARTRLAIATSKGRRGLEATLDVLGWQGRFDPIITPGEVTRPKPDPESLQRCLEHHHLAPAQAAYLGDARFDMEMAVAAGVAGWGAAWGLHDAATLTAAGARRCFATPAELLATLTR